MSGSTGRTVRLTVDVAETTCFTFNGVMKTSGSIDSDAALPTVQTSNASHAATGTNTAELEKSEFANWRAFSEACSTGNRKCQNGQDVYSFIRVHEK